jgi:hypothetical protein
MTDKLIPILNVVVNLVWCGTFIKIADILTKAK